MCGIAGAVVRDHELPSSSDAQNSLRQIVERMTAAIAHRGPDGSGTLLLPCGQFQLGLGHRRLSIIDTTAAGSQPMVHPTTGDALIYNGEIYNFRELAAELESQGVVFRGHSDSEVLLHALVRWGLDLFDRLRGMYAFAWYSPVRRTLVVARDPLGIKPLYLAQTPTRLLIASEIRAVVASGLNPFRVDPRALTSFLAFGAVQAPFTICEGVEEFPAGAWREYRLQGDELKTLRERQWRLPGIKPWSLETLQPEIQTTLSTSVRDHLVSDVPLGVFLSSGIDSATVAALAREHRPEIECFTVGFAENQDLDETALASETAAALKVNHRQIVVGHRESLSATQSWVMSLDSPSIDGLNVYLITQALRSEGFKVALSGQGADELFGGYPSFRDLPRALRLTQRLPTAAPFRRLLRMRRPGLAPYRIEKLIDMLTSPKTLKAFYLRRRRVFDDAWMRVLCPQQSPRDLADDYLPFRAHEFVDHEAQSARSDDAWLVAQLESRLYLGNMLLRDGDTASMAQGFEIRVPFLDRRVVELMASVPEHLRLPVGSAKKPLLTAAMADRLPEAVFTRKKRGFQLPYGAWMKGPQREVCEANLSTLRQSNHVLAAGVVRLWKRFLQGDHRIPWVQPWALCVLGGYLRANS